MGSIFIHSPLDDAGTSFTIPGTLGACSSATEEQRGQEITSLESLNVTQNMLTKNTLFNFKI